MPRSRCTACLRIGFTEEAARFRDWLTARWQDADRTATGRCSSCTRIDGRSDLTEEELDHLEGYRGSRPVRIGNAAPRAAAAGHLRRADGRGLPAQQVRRPARLRRLGAPRRAGGLGVPTTGAGRTRASGRCAAAGGTSSTRSSCAGWRWTAACGWPTSGPSRPTGPRWLKVRDEIYEEVMATGLDAQPPGVRPVLRLRRPGRLDAADAADLLHGPQRPAHARPRWTRSAGRRPPGGLAADGLVYRYDPRPPRTGCRASKGRSTCAPSGWSRR